MNAYNAARVDYDVVRLELHDVANPDPARVAELEVRKLRYEKV